MAITVYRQGQQVEQDFQSLDSNGDLQAATAAAFTVTDAAGALIVGSTAVPGFVSGESSASVVVSALQNTLTAGRLRDMRIVTVVFTTAIGQVSVSSRYVIESDQALVLMTNSFQTLDEAELASMDLTSLKIWSAKTDAQKRAALVDAFYNLSKLRFPIAASDYQDRVSYGSRGCTINDIRLLTVTEFNGLDAMFLQALRRAQVVEADAMMEGDMNTEYRRRGIISYTIGETSQFFGSAKALDLPIGTAALKQLTGYITWSAPLTRT